MFEEVREILAQQLKVNKDDITLESNILKDLGADSLDVLQLLMTIEETKGIRVPDEEFAKFVTVGDVVKYLESL
ncbi:MAG: acyl carrier protein [Lachnospiraceae bacterium]|nr:acyl carrier protein [Lachnospiraceae bacterium]